MFLSNRTVINLTHFNRSKDLVEATNGQNSNNAQNKKEIWQYPKRDQKKTKNRQALEYYTPHLRVHHINVQSGCVHN